MGSIRGGTEAPPLWLPTNEKKVPPPMGLGEDGVSRVGGDC